MISTTKRLIRVARATGTTKSRQLQIVRTLFTLQVKAKLHHLLKKTGAETGKHVYVRFFGYKMFATNYVVLDYLFQEIFLSEVYFFHTTATAPVIIDCGSNIGFSILYFKHLYPTASVVGFEANSYTFELLQHNLQVNKVKNVLLHQVALSTSTGSIEFYVKTSNPTTINGSLTPSSEISQAITVKAARLSDYLRELPHIDLIKMDVEGAELLIIRDLEAAGLLTRADQYIIEIHENHNDAYTREDFIHLFLANGFTCVTKKSLTGSASETDTNVLHFMKGIK